MKDEFKMMLNRLQNHLVESYESDHVLLIFDTAEQKEKYKQIMISKHWYPSDHILKTVDELIHSEALTGLRFKRYWFMTEEDLSRYDERG